MRRNWLTPVERQYVQTLLDEAIQHVKVRDMKTCAAFVQHAIETRRMSKTMLRPDVIDVFAKPQCGFCLVQQMLNRHAGYKNLPLPLRGKALHQKAEELGLVERTMTVRVDASTVRNECNMAEGRKKMKMTDEIGRDCKRVVMLQTKKKQCVQGIIAQATATGVADITRVWRDFHYDTKVMTKVCLKAIAAVAKLKHVYVLDIHKLTCLFHFPVFQVVLKLLTPSHIFAINMGEDERIFDRPHFQLLASKILDGSSAVRRWFVESIPNRRAIWVECGLVRDLAHLDKPNVFTLARREDCNIWKKGERHQARLAWLLAPETAYTAAKLYKTSMQDSTCKWTIACAKRAEGTSEAKLVAL